ncbi:MAG: ribosome biogenesis GTP-binding protein YihA/YsxC, partial [Ureaplasma sp.]|nr:ribosome biogenesis GTP-binding protein YihA/YsxC [Ureaplasma sp.]
MIAKFIKSATDVEDFFKDKRPQICLVGRSNVGKSSLINALANISNLAKVSKTPGRTRLINFFDFDKFVLVDLPGYGYAKADLKTRELIYDLIINCLNYNEKLTTVIQLCNIDVLTDDDQKMSIFLNKLNVNHLVFLTKADKVNN